jgi:hypothetical protein
MLLSFDLYWIHTPFGQQAEQACFAHPQPTTTPPALMTIYLSGNLVIRF